ncbi:MAG: BrnT family toxin [Deltaproteobacteria bacterium]|nr:BrnT family toxin [Deltaproteobacteria bacterium]
MSINYNFEWDPKKAKENQTKHDVAFDEAATVFRDSKALSVFDPDHSQTEDRWVTMGISEKGRLLIVIHTFLEENEIEVTIRIISGRKATQQETKRYGESL